MKAKQMRYRFKYNLLMNISYISSNCYTKRQLKYGNLENKLSKIKTRTCVKSLVIGVRWRIQPGMNQTIH